MISETSLGFGTSALDQTWRVDHAAPGCLSTGGPISSGADGDVRTQHSALGMVLVAVALAVSGTTESSLVFH